MTQNIVCSPEQLERLRRKFGGQKMSVADFLREQYPWMNRSRSFIGREKKHANFVGKRHSTTTRQLMRESRLEFLKDPWQLKRAQERIRNVRCPKEKVARGERASCVKMTAEEVRQIRADYAAGQGGYRALAKKYGIAGSTAQHILSRKTWKHIE